MADHRVGFDRSHQQADWDYLFDSFTDPARDYQPVDALADRPALDALDVLVVAPPRKSMIPAADATAVQRWVRSGHGVLILGYYAADTHHESNPSAIARLFGFEFGDDLLLPAGASGDDSRRHVFTLDPRLGVTVHPDPASPHPALAGVSSICALSSCSIAAANPPASTFLLDTPADTQVMLPDGPKTADGFRRTIYTWNRQHTGGSPVLAMSEHGAGRVAICGTWKIFTLDAADNRAFADGLIAWLAAPSRAAGPRPPAPAAVSVVVPSVPANTAIRGALVEHFNLDEMRTLSADLNVDFENIAGDAKESKARELVDYFTRRDRLPELVAKIRAERGPVV